jgi:hypothetical protein
MKRAFRDSGDGYYEVDVPEGQPLPEWVARLTPCPLEPAAPADWRTPVWTDFKARRETMLNRLTGIAGRCARAGLTEVSAAADNFALGLLDLPEHASVQPDVTPDKRSLEVAITRRYKELATVAKATPGAADIFDKVAS